MKHEMTEEERAHRDRMITDMVQLDRGIRWREMQVLDRVFEEQRCFIGSVSCYSFTVVNKSEEDVSRAFGTMRDDLSNLLIQLNENVSTMLFKFATKYVDEGWRGEYT